MPWYDREDYKRILDIMADAAVLPETYEKWRYAADKLVSQIERSGGTVVRAKIDPDAFAAWCRSRDLKVDAQARIAFANEAAYEAAKQTH
ncbi:hypothetical protein BF49_3587 [Bradyrhizobium sp.]|uniref:hypothetical protein n=1 Tax=Bradyrhizobium sp. TaxID=376 RepID=UPI0007C1D7B1|nr:hypothetical protein [Bradyrhizobium sp.]CUT12507.1 hypothetical protein BF49_3587 [Bradyrhizobium sp.]